MSLEDTLSPQKDLMNLQQGDCIHLEHGEELFQVIGVDYQHEKCWIRHWPLLPKGSPVFEISIQKIVCPSNLRQE